MTAPPTPVQSRRPAGPSFTLGALALPVAIAERRPLPRRDGGLRLTHARWPAT